MSQWAYVRGTIIVSPMGRTQPEKRYILDTILDHLPRVTGSEGDMDVYVIQKKGHNSSSSCDEFGMNTNNLESVYGGKSNRGWLNVQSLYVLVVDGSLRDRTFNETKKEFLKWLCRLAKRVTVEEILVTVESFDGRMLIRENMGAFWNMFEDPSWANKDREPTWCEYLMWDKAKGSDMPMMLAYKYYADEENDAEVERRMGYDDFQRRG